MTMFERERHLMGEPFGGAHRWLDTRGEEAWEALTVISPTDEPFRLVDVAPKFLSVYEGRCKNITQAVRNMHYLLRLASLQEEPTADHHMLLWWWIDISDQQEITHDHH